MRPFETLRTYWLDLIGLCNTEFEVEAFGGSKRTKLTGGEMVARLTAIGPENWRFESFTVDVAGARYFIYGEHPHVDVFEMFLRGLRGELDNGREPKSIDALVFLRSSPMPEGRTLHWFAVKLGDHYAVWYLSTECLTEGRVTDLIKPGDGDEDARGTALSLYREFFDQPEGKIWEARFAVRAIRDAGLPLDIALHAPPSAVLHALAGCHLANREPQSADTERSVRMASIVIRELAMLKWILLLIAALIVAKWVL